ncbi:uncharacterized protein [Temnothorax longispinosus]|uniref:uncharacterized protein isoform X3 n=1 Tax=Temnothorax longispinosus TaxID=300112 RepID=UPI003A99D987
MINVVDKYFSLNRILLLIVGLWPYEKSNSFVIKYNSFYVNDETVKYLMEQIQHIYNDLRDNNEIAIVERYASNAKHYTAGLTMIIVAGSFIFVGAQVWPDFIHIILSANVSQSRNLQISTEYFIDQKRYFFLSLFHINAAMIIGCFVLTATGTMLIAYLQHACGMFKIASYRIERAIQIYIPKNINMQNEIMVYKGIIRAVDIHRKAMIFSNCLRSKFEISFMFLIAVGVLTLSLNIFRVFQIVLFGYNSEEFLMNLVIASICFLYMFMANFIGQQIIDHNNRVFATAYKVRWYATPLHIQRLILFLLQRGNKNFGLCVGGLFIASIECFATLTNASISYFTIMYTIMR